MARRTPQCSLPEEHGKGTSAQPASRGRGLRREISSALATWYGLAPDQLQDAREPRPGASSVEEILPLVWERLGVHDTVRQLALASDWPEIVGAAAARHARPVGMRHGILVIEVDHPAWSAELERFHRHALLERIADRFGQGWIRDIRCRVG